MHFLIGHLNSEHNKLNTNDSPSKAKSCQCSGKKLGLLKPIFNKKCSIFSLICSLYKYFCKHMDQECPV